MTTAVPEHRVLLRGIVGSQAYGLAGPESDVDRLGLFAVLTQDLHIVTRPEETHVSRNPDVTYHEAAKWCRLALSCNPTITELVWLPSELYEVRTELGDDLIAIRSRLLNARGVKNAYLGYATQQFKQLESRKTDFSADTRKRTAKHARHLMRLCWQGFTLYSTGTLPIRVAEPERFIAFGQRIEAGHIDSAKMLLSQYEDLFHRTTPRVSEHSDVDAVNRWLRFVRLKFLRDA